MHVNAHTSAAPIALANMIARWPKPPTPTTPTFLPGPHPLRFRGEYTVSPAHIMGAATLVGRASGTGKQ
jgi:hypothetical protein